MDVRPPLSYRWLRANGVDRFVPWYFFDEARGAVASKQFAREWPAGGDLYTFAHRQDCDDFAGFVIRNKQATEQVIYYHPSFQEDGINPWIIAGTYPDLWSFLREVVISDAEMWCAGEKDVHDLHGSM